MTIHLNELTVLHFAEKNRFEIRINGLVAELTYSLHNDTITFLHTGVPPEWEGQGVGRKLVKTGLDYARANGFKIRSMCWFVSLYLQRHPEYQTS
jgi:predicted GNAT family acetyltransferase